MLKMLREFFVNSRVNHPQILVILVMFATTNYDTPTPQNFEKELRVLEPKLA